MGQKSLNFCDTTQIDVLENARSLTRTIIRAPMDNGWDARRSLLDFRRSVRPLKSIHRPSAAPITPPGTLFVLICIGYFSPS